MNVIFRDLLRRYVLVFFDNILIYSKTWEEHLLHLWQVLKILKATFISFLFRSYLFKIKLETDASKQSYLFWKRLFFQKKLTALQKALKKLLPNMPETSRKRITKACLINLYSHYHAERKNQIIRGK